MNNNSVNNCYKEIRQGNNNLTRTSGAIKNTIVSVFCGFFILSGNALSQVEKVKDPLKFFDGQSFTIIGKFHNEDNYVRFPLKYKSVLREHVWDLGQNSAGISIRFRTDASEIAVRWTVMSDNSEDHMPSTGVKGIDLYAFIDDHWKYVNTGRVKGKRNEYTLVKSDDAVYREYLLNLPLYDGIDSLSIGINESAVLEKPMENRLIAKKPVVYYGSSIAQGGCASRPGMAFTNILSRAMDRSFINMGFSGSGTFDLPVGDAMCETDASLYVIDCNPNTTTELIYDRAVELVKLLKKKRPEVPVLLVEAFYYENGFGKPEVSENAKKNIELQRAFRTLKKSDIKKLYYKKGDGLIGYDHEGTVDGVHPNDLGMMRIAESLKPVIKRIIRLNEN